MSVLEKFVSDGLVGDLIDEAPGSVLSVSYPESGVTVNGTELTPTEVKDQPKVEFEAEAGSFYALLLTDPDAPTRQDPKFREVRHWLVVNIPGNKIDEGDVVSAYVGSGPPQGSGIHRYVFLLFKQENGKTKFDLPITSNRSREGRLSTNTRKLMTDYNLKLKAGNFYFAQWDDYVPILHAQVGGPPPKA